MPKGNETTHDAALRRSFEVTLRGLGALEDKRRSLLRWETEIQSFGRDDPLCSLVPTQLRGSFRGQDLSVPVQRVGARMQGHGQLGT